MECGYFGKCGARADFITRGLPKQFLRLWETWMAAGLEQSRADLGADWEAAYMTMPIWRFLLHPSGENASLPAPVAGAFMPNVDARGRMYPLMVCCTCNRQGGFDILEDQWFADVEATLLRTLEATDTLEAFQWRVGQLDRKEVKPVRLKSYVYPEAHCIELSASEQAETDLVATFGCRVGNEGVVLNSAGLPGKHSFKLFVRPDDLLREREAISDCREIARHDRSEDLRS